MTGRKWPGRGDRMINASEWVRDTWTRAELVREDEDPLAEFRADPLVWGEFQVSKTHGIVGWRV